MVVVMKGQEYRIDYVMAANTILDLSNNNLKGKIPASIWSLRSLRLLNLSRNQLEGKIPPSIGQISTLEQLDLSHNQLSGRIPEELSSLSKLASLDVSSNRLSAAIPGGTQFGTFNKTAFADNEGLCGPFLPKCNQSKPEKPAKPDIVEGLGWSVWRRVVFHGVCDWIWRDNLSYFWMGKNRKYAAGLPSLTPNPSVPIFKAA